MKQVQTFMLLILCFAADGQITWTTGTNIASNTYGNNHPRLVSNRFGNPMVIWGRTSDESVYFSRWTGTMFTTPIQLNNSITIATASWMGPDVASHGDTLFVVMKQTPEADTSSHIYIVRSFDGGQTFSNPLRIDYIGDSISRFPTVTTDSSGNPIVAFMKFNAAFADSRWVVLKSTDYGNTFSNDVKASGWGGSSAVCDCCPGAIISNNNNCMMLYRNNYNNIRDTWVGFSDDNASSFNNGCNIDNNNWVLSSCPATGPDGVVINDTLYSVFCNGASGNYLSYVSKTSVNTASWNSTQNLTTAIPGLTQQNFPRIASYDNATGIVWRQVVNGSTQLALKFTNDILNGLPSTNDTVDLDNITNCDITIAKQKVAVCWQDDGSGTVKIRIGTYAASTTGISQQLQSIIPGLIVYPNPADDLLNIHLINNNNYSLEISNVFGSKVFSSMYDKQDNIIPVKDFASGIYFVTIKTKTSVNTSGILIQH